MPYDSPTDLPSPGVPALIETTTVNEMTSLPLADLFDPPEGFNAPVGAHEGADFARQFGDDFASYWRACPRADHMLYVAGWHDIDLRGVLVGGVAVVQQCVDLLPPDDTARSEFDLLRRWLPSNIESRSVEWKDTFEEDYLMEHFGSGRHEAQSAVSALVSVAKYGRNLGPALPALMAQIATWPVRSQLPQRWALEPRSLEMLADFARILRSEVDAAVIEAAHGPRFMPDNWADAKLRWPEMFDRSRE